MVKGWRDYRRQDFPIYYVQIAPFRYDPDNPESCDGTIVRDQLRRALKQIGNSAMVVIDDVSDVEDIHPKYKDKVGERLAVWALNKIYGLTGEIPCGPLYESMAVENGQVRLTFSYANGALKTSDGKAPSCFTIAGADKVFHPAQAGIEGDTVVVSSPEVPNPVAVRMAWRDIDTPNLLGGTGLPASCFLMDNWPFNGK